MYKIYHRYGLLSISKVFLGTSKVAKWDNLLLDGLNICLLNGYYDAKHPEQIEKKGESFPIYDDTVSIVDSENSRKAFINIVVSDLQKEYDRIISLGIAEKITPIRYLNVFAPYWYFTFADPDGNPIEITGEYQEIK